MRIQIKHRDYLTIGDRIKAVKCISWLYGIDLIQAEDIFFNLYERRYSSYINESIQTIRIQNDGVLRELMNIPDNSGGNHFNMYAYFYIEPMDIEREENGDTNSIGVPTFKAETVENLKIVMEYTIGKLLELDSPEVLQSSVILLNTIKKHLKQLAISDSHS